MPTTPATSSNAEPPTSDPDASSAETATAPPTTNTTPWTRARHDIDLSNLSTRSKAIKILIGDKIPDGYKLNEIARELGVSPSWVSQRLDELRNELLLSAGHFLPLSDTEYAALRDSIAEHGQRVPILVGTSGLLDGKHRLLILRELGIQEALVEFVTGFTPDEEHQIALAVNAARRMLTRAQTEQLVRHELERDWNRSSRQIAAACGVSHPTVETIRQAVRAERAAEAGEQPPQTETARSSETRTDRAGTTRPAYPERPAAAAAPEQEPHLLGTAPCAHGQTHAIYHHGDSYRLQAI